MEPVLLDKGWNLIIFNAYYSKTYKLANNFKRLYGKWLLKVLKNIKAYLLFVCEEKYQCFWRN